MDHIFICQIKKNLNKCYIELGAGGSCVGGGDWEDHTLRPGWAKSLSGLISTNIWVQRHVPVTQATDGSIDRRVMI
jgi:hypothetical protein